MNIPIFKIFVIFGIVSTWAEQALKDGKVTLLEAVELATKLAALLGITTELEIPTAALTLAPETDEEEPLADEETGPGHARPPPKN